MVDSEIPESNGAHHIHFCVNEEMGSSWNRAKNSVEMPITKKDSKHSVKLNYITSLGY